MGHLDYEEKIWEIVEHMYRKWYCGYSKRVQIALLLTSVSSNF